MRSMELVAKERMETAVGGSFSELAGRFELDIEADVNRSTATTLYLG